MHRLPAISHKRPAALRTGPDHRDTNASTDLAKWRRDVQALYKGVLPIEITLVWDVPDDLPPIAIAPHALTQAVLNLINNAKDAIERDSAGQVSIHAEADADAVALTVEDDGPGMQDEVRSRALEPFFTTNPGDFRPVWVCRWCMAS
jgi:signal transduction histidine kinase